MEDALDQSSPNLNDRIFSFSTSSEFITSNSIVALLGVNLLVKKRYLFFLFLTLGVMMLSVACDNGTKANLAEGASPPHELPVEPPEPPPGLVFALTVETAWEKTDKKKIQKRCEITDDTNRGEEVECLARIPEGELFFGDLYLTIGTQGGSPCEYIEYNPFIYLASVSKTYKPFHLNATVDCSELAKPRNEQDITKYNKECFGGPGAGLASQWPRKIGFYHISAGQPSTTYKIPAANTQGRYSNRWSSNTLPIGMRNTSLEFKDYDGGTYIGDGLFSNQLFGSVSWHDYMFECRDRYHELHYSFRLTIDDIDTKVGDPTNPNDPMSPNHWSNWIGGEPFTPMAAMQSLLSLSLAPR